jgi:hypothetical protein
MEKTHALVLNASPILPLNISASTLIYSANPEDGSSILPRNAAVNPHKNMVSEPNRVQSYQFELRFMANAEPQSSVSR